MVDILEVLGEFGVIEWARRPNSTDINHHPELKVYSPIIVWQYADADPQLAEILTNAIKAFKGKIEWSLDTSKKNWVLHPSRVRNAFEQEELGKTDPKYGIQAYDELPKLAEHIRTTLQEMKG